MLLKKRAAGSADMPKFDPVLLELGEAGEDGERLVFDKYQPRVQRFFEKKGFSAEEARDLTQDTFLRVFRGEAALESRQQLEAWLFQIARHVGANAVRAQRTDKRDAAVISLDAPGTAGEPREVADRAGHQDALAHVITHEQIQALQRALAELPEQMRHCVRLRLLKDLKYKEIAQIMRISTDTVKTHLHHGKKRLQSLLKAHFGPIDF